MNKSKRYSVAHKVLRRIEDRGGDTIWTLLDFPEWPSFAVALALSRMAKAGKIERLRRGVYYHPKNTVIGKSRPNRDKVADAVFRLNGTKTVNSGLSQFNLLGFTTQMAGALTRTADRPTYQKSILGVPLKVRYRPRTQLTKISAEEQTLLDVLRNIDHIPDATTKEALERFKALIRDNKINLNHLTRFALKEPPRVRALLGALIENLYPNAPKKKELVGRLKKSLNELTTYRLRGVREALPTADHWGFK